MIDFYMEEATPLMFLAGFFRTPDNNFYTSEEVEIDIRRAREKIAIVVQDIKAGARENEATYYTNKGFIPPVFREAGTINAYDLMKRRAGQVDFTDPNFTAAVTEDVFHIARILEDKIRRSIELMCAQVLQQGIVTLIDDSGAALYTLDFQMKATHKKTVTTTWATDGTTGTPITDLADLAGVVRRDGKVNPNKLIFGSSALQRFLVSKEVKALLDKQVLNLGALTPASRGQGATFYGYVWLGSYRFEVWTYDAWYEHPQTEALTPYLDPDNVIMLSDQTRLDLSYGAIPRLMPPDPQIAAFLPSRMSDGGAGLDLSLNAWITENREHMKVTAGTRPLPIPTAIDGFARLDVTA
jgi:hypothetical protein